MPSTALRHAFTPHPLCAQGDSELLLRARAMECIGIMNLAVGRTVCEPCIEEVTRAAIEGLALDLPELREYTCAATASSPPGGAQHMLPLAVCACRARIHKAPHPSLHHGLRDDDRFTFVPEPGGRAA